MPDLFPELTRAQLRLMLREKGVPRTANMRRPECEALWSSLGDGSYTPPPPTEARPSGGGRRRAAVVAPFPEGDTVTRDEVVEALTGNRIVVRREWGDEEILVGHVKAVDTEARTVHFFEAESLNTRAIRLEEIVRVHGAHGRSARTKPRERKPKAKPTMTVRATAGKDTP